MSGIPVRHGSSASNYSTTSSSRPLSARSNDSTSSRDSALRSLKSRFSLSKSKRRSVQPPISLSSNNNNDEELHITNSASTSRLVADPFARTDDALLQSRFLRRPLSASLTHSSAHSSPSLASTASNSKASSYLSQSAATPSTNEPSYKSPPAAQNLSSTSYPSLQDGSADVPAESNSEEQNKQLQPSLLPALQNAPPSPKALTHGNSPSTSSHRMPISSSTYAGHRRRPSSESTSSSNLKKVASPESPTIVRGSFIPEAQTADLPVSYDPEEQQNTLELDGIPEERTSQDLDWLYVRQQHHRRSPLDELIQGLGGEPRSGPESDGTASHIDPLERTPQASPLVNNYRTPTPLEALNEVDPDIETGAKKTHDPQAVNEASNKLRDSLLGLPSSWSNTNSNRTSSAAVEAPDTDTSPRFSADETSRPHVPDTSFPTSARWSDEPGPDSSTRPADQNLPPVDADLARRRSAQDLPMSSEDESSRIQWQNQPTLTPKTSRRWSIVEMEQAYDRMKELFASNASFNKSILESSVFEQHPSLSVLDIDSSAGLTPRPNNEDGAWSRSVPGSDSQATDIEQSRQSASQDSQNAVVPPGSASVQDGASEFGPDLPGGFPSESSFTSEMRDEVGPLHQRGSADSPKTFSPSLFDDDARSKTPVQQHETPPAHRPNHLQLSRSTSASALDTPQRTPTGFQVPGSARSMTTVYEDAWDTPRSNFTALRGDDREEATMSSTDQVLAWTRSVDPSVGPQPSSLLLRGRPSRYSASERDDWTLGSRSRNTTPTESDMPWSNAVDALSKSRRRHLGSSHSRQDESLSSYANSTTLSDFRTMDKLELFLKFSQTLAEHEALKKKSAMEREALFDALSETRSALYDVRKQREQLLRKVQSQESRSDHTERINSLLRSKTLWQERAQSAATELDTLRQALDESHSREEASAREVTTLNRKVSSLSSQLKETESKLASALEMQQKVLDELATSTITDDEPDASSAPMQSTPPRSRSATDIKNTYSPIKPASGLPQSNSYTRLPKSSRIASPRTRHQSTATTGSLADYDRLQSSANSQSTPLRATKMQLASPDNSLSESANRQPSRIAKPKSALPRYRTTSNNSTRSTISTSALNDSVRSESSLSTSAFADQGPGRPQGLFDLQEDSQVGLNSEDMAFLKNLDSQ